MTRPPDDSRPDPTVDPTFDPAFDDLVARLDLDQSDRATSERMLLELAAGPALPPPSAAWVEAHVARATAPVAAPRRWSRAAGILGGALVLAAATFGAYLVWPEGRDSRLTMTYPMALELLARPDQPAEHRLSGMGRVVGSITSAIEALQAVRRETNQPALAQVATLGLVHIAAVLDGTIQGRPGAVDDTVSTAYALLTDATQPDERRIEAAGQLTQLAMNGAAALMAAPQLDAEALSHRQIAVNNLLRVARRR